MGHLVVHCVSTNCHRSSCILNQHEKKWHVFQFHLLPSVIFWLVLQNVNHLCTEMLCNCATRFLYHSSIETTDPDKKALIGIKHRLVIYQLGDRRISAISKHDIYIFGTEYSVVREWSFKYNCPYFLRHQAKMTALPASRCNLCTAMSHVLGSSFIQICILSCDREGMLRGLRS